MDYKANVLPSVQLQEIEFPSLTFPPLTGMSPKNKWYAKEVYKKNENAQFSQKKKMRRYFTDARASR